MINPTNKQLIKDLLHENNKSLAVIYSKKDNIKRQLSKIETLLCQCGVNLANLLNSNEALFKVSKILNEVIREYALIHLERKDILNRFAEIDKIRGDNNAQ